MDGRKLILDQVKGEPGRYKGKIREKSLGAILKYDVRVKNPKRLTGILRSNFSQDGRTCTLARDFDSRWVSK